MSKTLPKFVADFEATTDPNDCRVWAYGIALITANPDVVLGHELDDFMDYVFTDDCEVYFHNLKYDGTFIMDWLFRHGYQHRKTKTPDSGYFSTLISIMGAHYSITVTSFAGTRVTFKDSAKKLPMKVADIASAFQLEESKGDIDYHLPRPVGYRMTEQERDYVRRDVTIVAQALHRQFQAGMTKLTVGADSLADFTRTLGRRQFSRTFPVLPLETDNQIRMAYRGGFTYVDPRFQGKRVGAGSVYDVNSLYPHVMRNRTLPYGEPEYFSDYPEHDPQFPLFILSITLTAKLKKDHIPCIQIKNHPDYNGREWQRVINDPVTLFCTSVDLRLWEKHYDLEIISYNGGFKFHAIDGMFNEYVDKWNAVKANHKGGLRTIAKLHLNSLYGKFATNPDTTGKIPVFENDAVKLVVGEEESRDPVYTAMGAFVTSYAREITITAAQENYDRFIYADTDSLHLLGTEPPKGITVDPTELGAWKHEYNFSEAKFMRAKQYIEHKTNGEYETHFAGLGEEEAKKLTIDDVQSGRVIPGGLKQIRVPGGAVLVQTEFTL